MPNMVGRCRIVAVAVAVWIGASAALADDARLKAYGHHLAAECTSCHRIDGVDNGIPSITGWPVAEFIETMKYYKDGMRPNQAMRSVASSLDDAQFTALAAFFSSLPKPVARK
jgi:cytochrome c553